MFILVRKLICCCKKKFYILLDGVPLQRKIHFSINKLNGIKLIFEKKRKIEYQFLLGRKGRIMVSINNKKRVLSFEIDLKKIGISKTNAVCV